MENEKTLCEKFGKKSENSTFNNIIYSPYILCHYQKLYDHILSTKKYEILYIFQDKLDSIQNLENSKSESQSKLKELVKT